MSTGTPGRGYSGALIGQYQADILVHIAAPYPDRVRLVCRLHYRLI